MIKILGFILTIAGAISLVMGILGVFGSMDIGMSPWALIILGVIFFIAGIGLLKNRKDTDQT
ncbi:hypothetical protein [Cochleicola gelatinilyticus]|uniref:Uncharacterized protein n=1 Tax=Cochleicola gelatinilyticus TaxID=1763537 RepID=A0A167IDQ3_9FLAO|nr:hypothetical protein [Cochleicola gelatinilyticus]OAB79552.1 hypothetical protein ULVI_02015 [Cochleicola gelatinilyticus]